MAGAFAGLSDFDGAGPRVNLAATRLVSPATPVGRGRTFSAVLRSTSPADAFYLGVDLGILGLYFQVSGHRRPGRDRSIDPLAGGSIPTHSSGRSIDRGGRARRHSGSQTIGSRCARHFLRVARAT